jgi:serine/threonine protein kinase
MVNEQTKLGSIIGGRFILERLAGSGGMGDVYQAQDSHSGTLVALKLLRGSADGFARRFEREARTLAQLAQLDHAGIVRYVASGSEPSIFLAMEWLEGEDLSRRLSRGPLRIGETVQIALRVADALSAAHARGIVHRDIKPRKIASLENHAAGFPGRLETWGNQRSQPP